MIKPNGMGPTDAINRAELSAIYHTLYDEFQEDAEGLVFTDSQVALHLIRRAVMRPHTLDGHLHGPLLRDIARRLVERANAGIATHLRKVKSHSGVAGNEAADKAAKAAAQMQSGHDYVTPDHCPFEGHWRPAFNVAPDSGPEPASAADLSPAEQLYTAGSNDLRAVSNLNTALKKALHASTKTGTSKKGVCATETARMYDGVDGDRALGKESNAMLRSAPLSVVRTVLKHRFYLTWTKCKAFLRRRPYLLGRVGEPVASDGRCPLCGGRDSIAHMLLECWHSRVQATRIWRHDSAVRLILKALQKHTKHGRVYTIMDAGKAENLQEDGADGKRLPRWLLSEGRVPDDKLKKMRPDILLIKGLGPTPTAQEIQDAVNNKKDYTIQVVEVGYCTDTNWRSKIAEKMKQHQELLAALRAEGWTVDAGAYVVVLGACGAVYLSGQTALEKLGLSAAQAQGLLTKLHMHAVTAAHALTVLRRRLERSRSYGPSNRQGVG